MPRKKTPELPLPTSDDLFTTQEQRDEADLEKVQDIPLNLIDSFPDHPFKVNVDDLMLESVKTYGIRTPAVVRAKGDRFELVSGHRRKLACQQAGLEAMPCIIRNLTDDETVIAMVDSNFQRESVLPSEKGFSYKMWLEALNRQGKRTDLTSDQIGPKLRANEKVAKASGDSPSQIKRYIRLTELVPDLLEMVDEGQIALSAAAELSYLNHDCQNILRDMIESEGVPSIAQATEMKSLDKEGQLSNEEILRILKQEKPSQTKHFKLPREKIQHFFAAETPSETIEETIVKALELWQKSQQEPQTE